MGRYLISGGTVVDATGAAPKERTSVFVEGNRIAKVGADQETKAIANKEYGQYVLIDASGQTVMPDLIDVHVHSSYGDCTSAEELNIYTSAEYRALRGALNLRKVLRAGVTSICDPGGAYRLAPLCATP